MPKGQHSWNISLTKEARVDPKVVLELSMECLTLEIFFARKKIRKKIKTYFKIILQALLLVTNQTDPFRGP